MRHRPVVWLCATATAASLLSFASIRLSGQAAPAGGAPRTPWGAPDLQGIWSQDTFTPFERTKDHAGREFLTEAERAEQEKRIAQEGNTPGRNRDIRAERGSEQDVAGAYNALWEGDRPRKAGRRTSLVVDPADGRIPPLTPQAQQRLAAQRDYLNALLQGTSGGLPGPTSPRRAERPPVYNLDRMNRADGPEDRSAGERCFGAVMPAIGALQRIVQSPDSVTIFYDIGQGGGFSRVIPITDAPHLPSSIRQFHGDARARWEGDTLVVDVTNFSNRSEFRGSRENLHLVERFTRLGPNTLEYRVTVEDPTTWTRPWTAVVELAKNPDKPNLVFEQTCHEGNYGMVGMLANTRAQEKLFAEGKGEDPAKQDLATGGDGSALPAGVGIRALRAQMQQEQPQPPQQQGR
jgi:hypothetical protein